MQKTDEEIATEVQNGNLQEFGILVERYEDKMHRYARRFLFGYEEAADVVQEVFIKAYINIQSFDVNRQFSPWIYRIAHNEFINTIKKNKREPVSFFDPDTLFPHPFSKQEADKLINEKEIKEMMEKCLKELHPKYREPLVLHYYEDLDYKKIAEIMHIPVSTVGVRLRRGKETLKKKCDKLTGNI